MTAVDAASERKVTRIRRRRAARLTLGDRVAVALMLGVPLVFVVGLIWVPTVPSVVLSFTSWDGIGGIDTIEWVGTRNYQQIVEIYPPFWRGVPVHPILAGVPRRRADHVRAAARLPARQEDPRHADLPRASLLPFVLSLAVIGFIWQLVYAPEQGLINNILGKTEQVI